LPSTDWATHKTGSKSKPTEARKKKERKKKGNRRRATALDHRRKRARVICRSLGGTSVESDCEPESYRILQPQYLVEKILSWFGTLAFFVMYTS